MAFGVVLFAQPLSRIHSSSQLSICCKKNGSFLLENKTSKRVTNFFFCSNQFLFIFSKHLKSFSTTVMLTFRSIAKYKSFVMGPASAIILRASSLVIVGGLLVNNISENISFKKTLCKLHLSRSM